MLLLLLQPVNRRPGVWKIVVPAVAIQVIVLALEVVGPNLGVGGFIVCADELNFIATAFAFLFLLAGHTRNLARPADAFLLALAMIGVGWAQVPVWVGLTFSTVGYLVLYTILAGAIIVALTFSALLCRKHWSPGRFLRVACVILLCISMLPLPLVGFIVLVEVTSSGDVDTALPIIGGAIVFLLGTGMTLCLLVSGYLGIALRNPDLRERFERIVRVQSDTIVTTVNGFAGGSPVVKEVL